MVRMSISPSVIVDIQIFRYAVNENKERLYVSLDDQRCQEFTRNNSHRFLGRR